MILWCLVSRNQHLKPCTTVAIRWPTPLGPVQAPFGVSCSNLVLPLLPLSPS